MFFPNEMSEGDLRENVLVCTKSKLAFRKFRQEILLPLLCETKGIIFCKPDEFHQVSSYFESKGLKYSLISSAESFSEIKTPFNSDNAILSKLTWECDIDNIVTKVLSVLTQQIFNDSLANSRDYLSENALEDTLDDFEHNVGKYVAWICVEMYKKRLGVDSLSLSPDLHGDLSTTSCKVLKETINKLASSQPASFDTSISFYEMLNAKHPIVVVENTDSFIGDAVLGAFAAFLQVEERKTLRSVSYISKRESKKTLILGLGDDINLNSFFLNFSKLDMVNWTVVVPQYILQTKFGKVQWRNPWCSPILLFMLPFFKNIFILKASAIRCFLPYTPKIEWYCFHSTRGNLNLSDSDIRKAVDEYIYDGTEIKSVVDPVLIKL